MRKYTIPIYPHPFSLITTHYSLFTTHYSLFYSKFRIAFLHFVFNLVMSGISSL